MKTFARALVDDMLAQARRVAQRKLKVDANGQMTLRSKLHERNGRYFADRPKDPAMWDCVSTRSVRSLESLV